MRVAANGINFLHGDMHGERAVKVEGDTRSERSLVEDKNGVELGGVRVGVREVNSPQSSRG